MDGRYSTEPFCESAAAISTPIQINKRSQSIRINLNTFTITECSAPHRVDQRPGLMTDLRRETDATARRRFVSVGKVDDTWELVGGNGVMVSKLMTHIPDGETRTFFF